MEIVKTDNETLKKEVEGLAAKNMEQEFKEMNGIPNPANFTLNGSMPNASQGFWADQRHKNPFLRYPGPCHSSPNSCQGVGELGKSFEFMMLKLAQLETLCELQQVEIETLRKTVKGLAEHVDHPDSVASLVQKDEKSRMQETQQTLKRVLAKHAQQHKNKDFQPEASRQNYRPPDTNPDSPKRAAGAGASDRAELLAGGAQQSGSKGCATSRQHAVQRCNKSFEPTMLLYTYFQQCSYTQCGLGPLTTHQKTKCPQTCSEESFFAQI